MTDTITSLNSLLDALKAAEAAEDEVAYCRSVGLPVHMGECDWTSLPTFGGEEPARTDSVWSWDETHVLTGTCADDLRIEPRDALALRRTYPRPMYSVTLSDPSGAQLDEWTLYADDLDEVIWQIAHGALGPFGPMVVHRDPDADAATLTGLDERSLRIEPR